ncbi:MAG: TonB-dependent receptor [Cyclobacteriaceae bacterium]|nr:TonB-dependent receptor [Cyclobacteriaceae bacterium]
MKKILKLYFIILSMTVIINANAQVTTASISGQITDSKGESLPGANVVAMHVPTGTQYGTTTRPDGRFNLPNLKVGGPYSISVTYVGYSDHKQDGITLSLGQNFKYNLEMIEDITQLSEVIITGEDDVFGKDRTGSASSYSNEEIQKMPTISRSAQDIYRLNPTSDGNSFAGRNDQFNNFSLDGSIFNNPFGLDAATPGGQTDAQPISLDAIEQIQVSIAPFDVSQSGFTGASINAVTKSGTNKLSGTVFGFYRNQNFAGSKISGEDAIVADLSQTQAGFSIGGPIIKDKLFFFANMEVDRRSDLGSSFVANRGTGAQNESRVLATDLERVSFLLDSAYNYQTGDYEGFLHKTSNQKGIVKLDWNINKSHTLTATYNFLDATKQKPAHPNAIGRRGPDATTLQFQNSGYAINNVIHSGLVELRSIFGNKASNKFQAGFTQFKDTRDPFSDPFPVINIAEGGVRYIVAGHEPFSVNNKLDQKVIQISNNFDLYFGDHTLTLGTSFEKFSFDNSFNLVSYGFNVFWDFPSVAAFDGAVTSGGFQTDVDNARAAYTTNEANDSWALAETNLGQWALYIQDKWEATDNLTVTLGLRMDVPLYFDTSEKIQESIDSKGGLLADGGTYDPSIEYFDKDGNSVLFDHTDLPTGNTLFSPRLGFNYDVNGDQSMQIRGGTGLFAGRLPFVWIGNQVANPDFFYYTMTDPNFKFPQVWRTNIGWDQKFGEGWTATVDLSYTKDINGMMVRNYGLKLPTGTLNGGSDTRPIYNSATDRTLVFGGPSNAYVFTNTNVGRTINTTFELKRNWSNGLYTSLSYNYLDSKDASSIEAEISGDAYDRNPSMGHTNEAQLAPSIYGNKHRIVGNTYKTFKYGGDKWATTFSLFFEYAQGGRFSYTYSGDINNDGSPLNDLIYIPTQAEISGMSFDTGSGLTEQEQRTALEAFITQDEYLSENRGDYAEKYAALSPWYSRWDFRLLQDYNLSNGNKVQLSIDVLNIGNLISSNWGVRQFPTNTQPIGVSVDGTNTPTYSFDPNQVETFTNDTGLISRWQMQFGLRYTF